jgi:NAD+ synthase
MELLLEKAAIAYRALQSRPESSMARRSRLDAPQLLCDDAITSCGPTKSPTLHEWEGAVFDASVLELDWAATAAHIQKQIISGTTKELRRRGVVVAVSGGIDSSACLALAVGAFGPKKVCAILMPERDSSSDSSRLGRALCERFGVEPIVEDIAPTLEALGCYRRRDEAIRTVFPEYDSSYKQKIVLPQNLLDADRLNFYSVVIESPSGEQKTGRLPLKAYLQVVASTNMKQRTRKLLEYYHADRLNYAVVGTPNRLEYDQGFFVKGGDGLADIKPIAHLYKTQVYALARHLGVPEEICSSTPTTDTYSLPQTQEEFYFALPYDKMDLLLYAYTNGVAAAEAAPPLGLTAEQVERVFRDIETKRRTTRPLHLYPLLVEPVDKVGNKRSATD